MPLPSTSERPAVAAAGAGRAGPQLRFRGATYLAACEAARQALGATPYVLEANRVRRGGIGGFFATDLGVEITVVPADDDAPVRPAELVDDATLPTASLEDTLARLVAESGVADRTEWLRQLTAAAEIRDLDLDTDLDLELDLDLDPHPDPDRTADLRRDPHADLDAWVDDLASGGARSPAAQVAPARTASSLPAPTARPAPLPPAPVRAAPALPSRPPRAARPAPRPTPTAAATTARATPAIDTATTTRPAPAVPAPSPVATKHPLDLAVTTAAEVARRDSSGRSVRVEIVLTDGDGRSVSASAVIERGDAAAPQESS
jgi:hypothetical protein